MISALLLSYNARYILRRRATSILTVCGIAMVVVVYAATLMLSEGLEKTLAKSGSEDNVIVIRNGAENEIQSAISREQASVILSYPAVARDSRNTPIGTTDVIVLLSLRKRSNGEPSNISVRGVLPKSFELRKGIRIVEGRNAARGTREVIVGSAVHRRFAGTDPGETLRLAGSDWKIAGIFDAGDSAFSSEIWGDADIMMPVFKRDAFSSVLFRLAPKADFFSVKRDLENDKRLSVSVFREQAYYESQSAVLAKFIRFLGTFVSMVFSLAAVIGCMITMYAAVSQRIREIAILRTIGFSRWAILSSFIFECMLLSLGGGLLGLLVSSTLAGKGFSTTNFQTFSDLTFRFTLTPGIAFQSLVFALLMGLAGAVLPAWRASRLKVVEALWEF